MNWRWLFRSPLYFINERLTQMALNFDALRQSVDAALIALAAGGATAAELAQAKTDLAAAQSDLAGAQATIDELQAKLAAGIPAP